MHGVIHFLEKDVDKQAIAKRLRTVKKAVDANEEKDRVREKQRVKEAKLQKKIKERALNVKEEAPAILLGSDGEEMGSEMDLDLDLDLEEQEEQSE